MNTQSWRGTQRDTPGYTSQRLKAHSAQIRARLDTDVSIISTWLLLLLLLLVLLLLLLLLLMIMIMIIMMMITQGLYHKHLPNDTLQPLANTLSELPSPASSSSLHVCMVSRDNFQTSKVNRSLSTMNEHCAVAFSFSFRIMSCRIMFGGHSQPGVMPNCKGLLRKTCILQECAEPKE